MKGLNLLSLNQMTKQSSTYGGGVSKRAVDGNTDPTWGGRSVTHTQSKQENWWQVDLGRKYPVHLILVHTRKEGQEKRINNAKVYLDTHLCGTITFIPNTNVYPINCGGFTGKVVKVVVNKEPLNLAEVMVYGVGQPFGGNGGVWGQQTGGELLTVYSNYSPSYSGFPLISFT